MRGLWVAVAAIGCTPSAAMPAAVATRAPASAAPTASPVVTIQAPEDEPFHRDRTPLCCEAAPAEKVFLVSRLEVAPATTPFPYQAVHGALDAVWERGCAAVRAKPPVAIASSAKGVAERLRLARRMVSSDPLVPPLERRARLWAEYDDAVQEFVVSCALAIVKPLAEEVLANPIVRDSFRPFSEASAVAHLGPDLGIATRCAQAFVDANKPSWLAILNEEA